jgi:phosphopantetheinyl transferase
MCQVNGESWADVYLVEAEKAEYAALKSAVRRKEWLSSRVALKKMLENYSAVESPFECLVRKDKFGCPRIDLVNGSRSATVNCSISHKNGMASVCISWNTETRLGIDMESVSTKPFKLRRAFCTKEDLLRGTRDPAARFTVLWTCKEAASKVMGMGLLKDFKELIVEADSDGRFAVSEKGKIVTRGTYDFVQGFVVAVCHQRSPLLEDNLALEDALDTISI